MEFPVDPGAEEFNLDVETEFNDVAVFHDVVLALDAQLASFAGFGGRAECRTRPRRHTGSQQ